MFTGIIQKTGKVIAAEKRTESLIVHIEKPSSWKFKKGASVNVDGICSTVRMSGATYFEVEYMPETLRKTTASSFSKGRIVNLETSLRMNELVDGHFVQGHIDTCGRIEKVAQRGNSRELTISAPSALMRLIAPTGSVTINGVSLTVAKREARMFTVALVSHTLAHTNLSALAKGDEVNIETDLFARYLAVARQK